MIRRCRNCKKILPAHGNLFFCDNGICTIRYAHSSKGSELTHSEVNKLMAAINAVPGDKKEMLNQCRRCTMECKIISAAWTKGFTVCCEADRALLREKARELGLTLVEISIGGEAPLESTSI